MRILVVELVGRLHHLHGPIVDASFLPMFVKILQSILRRVFVVRKAFKHGAGIYGAEQGETRALEYLAKETPRCHCNLP